MLVGASAALASLTPQHSPARIAEGYNPLASFIKNHQTENDGTLDPCRPGDATEYTGLFDASTLVDITAYGRTRHIID